MTSCWKNNASTKRKENRLYYINLESGISQWGIPNNLLLPAGWEMHLSKSQKIPFYSNFKKKISQWKLPSKEDGNEVPDGWEEMRSSKCKSIYYKNSKTGDVKWIIPDDEKPVELRSDIPTPIVLSKKLDLKPMGVGIPMPSGFNTKLDFKTIGVKPVGIGIPTSFLSIVEDCAQNKIWEKDKLLGTGKAGSVYVTCKASDCEYVIKIQEQNKEYYTEIEALLSLQHTKAVPKVFAAWTCEKYGYFVMEKLYPCTHNVNFMLIAVDIKLKEIREAGYLHLDIHTGNVMCNKRGEVVLIDFGYAVKRTQQGDKQEYPDNMLSEKYGIPLTWEYLEIVQQYNYNSCFNPLKTYDQKITNENIKKKYTDATTKVLLNKQQKEKILEQTIPETKRSVESVKYFMIVTTKNKHNDRLKKLYIKNYSYDKEFTPEYRYDAVISYNDIWFHLVNNNDMIIGCCSVGKKDNIYIIDDVYVEEKFRGHNYANLLLLYAMKSVRTNNSNASFQITAHDDNIPAVKTYSRIFGEPIRIENNMFLYSGIPENELEKQLKKVPVVSLV